MAYDRVQRLESMGIDISKVRTIIDNIKKEAPSQKKDNINLALTKLEGYLDRVEQIARKKEGKEGDLPDNEIQGPGMEAKGEVVSQGTMQGKADPGLPGEAQPVKPIPLFDEARVWSDKEMVSRLCKEVVSCGGDTSPIEPHLNAMAEAEANKDMALFEQYTSIVLEWLTAYLGNIHWAAISSSMAEINGLKGDFETIGRGEEVKELLDTATSKASVQPDATLEDLRIRDSDLDLIKRTLVDKHTEMVKAISEDLRDMVRTIRKMLSDLPEEGPTTAFKGALSGLEIMVQKGEWLRGMTEGKALIENVQKELNDRNRSKLDNMLRSVEPLIERVSQAKGPTSEPFLSLNREKISIMDAAGSDLHGALKRMEALLDKVSLAIVDIEEGSANKLEVKIKEARAKADDLKDVLDVAPIITILQRADDLGMEGDIETATKMVERALTAFDKLKEKKLLDQAALSLSELRTKMADLTDKAMDTTPLQGPVDRAKEALDRKDLKAFEEALLLVNEKLELLRGEELRVEYHGRLMALFNELNFLKKEGFDVAHLEKRLDDARSSFHDRKLRDAVDKEKGIREELNLLRLKGVLERRIMSVEGSIKEAEGLLLDVEEVSEALDRAKAQMAKGDLREALDSASTAQSCAEDLLMNRTYSMMEKEVRQMAEELRSFSIDPGDIDQRIKDAFGLADDERFKEAMESFLQLKDEVSRKLIDKKAEWTVGELGRKIKEARAAGLNISPFKASLTKAKVLLEAKDLESAVKVAMEQITAIEATLNEKRNFQSKLDELRGRLIAYDVKIAQLVKAGFQVGDVRERIASVRELVDRSGLEEAEAELRRLDMDINALMTPSVRDRLVPTPRSAVQGPAAYPGSTNAPGEPRSLEESTDPEEAYEELKMVIKRIQEEMRLLPQKGPKIDEIKKEIVKVQQLVIQKKYIEAYKMASRCYATIRSIDI